MNNKKYCQNKIIVFDIDETLMYGKQISYFWEIIKTHFTNFDFYQSDFNIFLDLYPNIIRQNIFKILEYIKNKKILKKCHKVMIYTNNKGGVNWIRYIKNYFEYKLNYYDFFDKIINAYKINNNIIEPCRTTNVKCYDDLINCSLLNKEDKIFYMDDIYYKCMNKPNVFYVNVEEYIYEYENEVLIDIFINNSYFVNKLGIKEKNEKLLLYETFMDKLQKYKKKNYICDIYYRITIKELMFYLKMFFANSKNKFTQLRKKKYIKYSKTKKNKREIIITSDN